MAQGRPGWGFGGTVLGTGVPHACDRAMERYGVSLSVPELRVMERSLRDGGGVLVRQERAHVEIRLVRFSATVMPAVFDRTTATIITFLAPEHLTVTSNRKRRFARARG